MVIDNIFIEKRREVMNFDILEPNVHSIGRLMREAVRRAIVAIRAERFIFESEAKIGYSGQANDMVTSADKKAQEIYIRLLSESFPGYGIIAEEDSLKIPCTHPTIHDIYFINDPMDGTKAYGRRQSHGVGTMLALVWGDEVIAAYVGDINTQEIYGYRPESVNVWRISEGEKFEPLSISTKKAMREQYVLFFRAPHESSLFCQKLIGAIGHNPLFKGLLIMGGGIGVNMAQLWKEEIGGVVLPPFVDTPWDIAPVIGISKKLGFVFYRFSDKDGEEPEIFDYLPPREKRERNFEILVIHKSRKREFKRWLSRNLA
jgi:fructose-1,6-bisphosphatase/inositol monophosphatase family enzyme